MRAFLLLLCTRAALCAVPRLDARALDRAALLAHLRTGPVVLTHALADSAESWADNLLSAAGEARVEYQMRKGKRSEVREARLGEFCELTYESSHSESVLLFAESLLQDYAPQLEPPALRSDLFEPDWFKLFPPELRPSPSCVIIGGEGARSTLHADPFEWVGTNVCVEGRKLWRFLPPAPDVKDLLCSYRLPSVAWGSKGKSLSAGWQSDFDLWARRRGDAPRARALNTGDPDASSELLASMADVSTGLLQPGTSLPADAVRRLVPCVQHAGDVVLIPPGWWHQTYYPEPSICSAGQYLDAHCRQSVFQHILDWTGNDSRADAIDEKLTPQEQVDALLLLLARIPASGERTGPAAQAQPGRGGAARAGLKPGRVGAGALRRDARPRRAR
ncbi:hypothetical protein T492DRAFT_1064781 [Pavlovales sp. CCMP2436]|nr:hypothetical protein T492DRAFT_1064781 [Pavlovales sp. CCMP2436]